jgi:polyisoprenoid-binding protein YceI
MRLGPLLAVFGAACALSAQAAEFGVVQAGRSAVTFVSKQMGVPVDGKFARFTTRIAFDPAKPAAGSARIDIDLASIDTGSSEANDEVVGKQWFNAKAFPTASFASSGVKALGGDRYEVAGKLSIKGRSKDVVAPFTFRQEGANGIFDGSFTLHRLDYAIGEGPWADPSAVANEVQIKFHVVASAAAARK